MARRTGTREERIALALVAGLGLAAALYTWFGVGMPMSLPQMTAMGGRLGDPMRMAAPEQWGFARILALFAMWWIMMIAMMLPSAAPVILLFAALRRVSDRGGAVTTAIAAFGAGYLAIWAGFSALAVLVHWGLRDSAAFASGMMALRGEMLVGLLLVAVGLYQLTPLKRACLRQCQSPAQFLTRHYRPGLHGAARMGAHHGVFCLGCCWALMLLLFAGGVMNLWWILGLALLVLLERRAAAHPLLPALVGAVLIAAGLAVMLPGAVGPG
ncbi:DUF2182 domain-containing protein [Sulfitobacter aestuarii]|uniref:DUF2182 domain-containing protein n=1 Tax=Sulfitobacter aestuarii TaxID=2161676 RepID=A0ABW5U6R0_9RHOB